MPIRVLCVDDHPLVRKGIASILATEPDIEVVAEASDGHEAVELYGRYRPDVTLMDLRMPVLDGIAATRKIRSQFPDSRIIALTSYDGDQDVLRALEAGVQGYLLKEIVHTEIIQAIRKVHAGMKLMSEEVSERVSTYFPATTLTPREVEVLQLVARGFANKEIAVQLGTAAGTVKIQVQNILAKLQASDRTHAVTIALQHQLIQLD